MDRLPSILAKRRACLAATVHAAGKGSLSLMGISRALSNATAIRHRIKRCDRQGKAQARLPSSRPPCGAAFGGASGLMPQLHSYHICSFQIGGLKPSNFPDEFNPDADAL
jgi:hypothetical protein